MDYKVIDFDKNFIYFTADKETAYEMSAYYVHPRNCYRFYTSLEAIEELELYDIDCEKLQDLKIELTEERRKRFLARGDGLVSGPIDWDNKPDKRMRAYQHYDYNFLKELNFAGVFNEQRTGKTPTTLVTVRDDDKIVIVCPAGLKLNWKKETKVWTNRDAIVITGTPAVRKKLYQAWKDAKKAILIVSYETLRADIEWLESSMKFGRKKFTIIADEVHRLRNYKTKQSKALYKLRKYAEKVYALTGTPAVNHPADVYGILRFLQPKKYTSYWQFVEYFFKMYEGYFAKEIGKLKGEKAVEFEQMLSDLSTNRKRKQVMKWIPKITKQTIPLEFDKKQLGHYKKATKELLLGDDREIPNPLALLTRLRQICADPQLLGLEGESPKTNFIKEFINDNTESIIIFSSFTSYLISLNRTLEGSVLLTGQQTQDEKDKNIKAFQSGEARILLANIKAGGVGFTLDKADTIIFADRSYNPVDNDQAADRFIPVSKDKDYGAKQIIDLVIDKSVENKINKLLEKKQNIISYVNNYSENGLVKLVQNEL